MAASLLWIPRPSWEETLAEEQVRRAAAALLEYVDRKKKKSNDLLEDDAEWIQLFVRYKALPPFFSKFPIQLELKRPFWNADDFRICLVIHDKSHGKRVQTAKALLVPGHVTEVMSVSTLRREFHDHSLKQELCRSYDLFLLELCVKDVASELFGSRFVASKKFPVLVKLTKRPEQWIEAVSAEMAKTQMYCHVQAERSIRVGRSTFAAEELTKNVFCVLKQMVERPKDGGWQAIMQLYLCTGTSVRLPIYQTFPDDPLIEVEGEKERPSKKRRVSRPTEELTKKLTSIFSHYDETVPAGGCVR